MTLICVGAAKGAPGATLTAVGLAAAWPVGPHQKKVIIEADPSGGSLAIRYQLPTSPGLLSLAARAGAGLDADQVWSSAQELPGGLAAILAPDRADQIAVALRSAGGSIGQWLAETPDIVAIADVGRLVIEPVVQPLIAVADAVLVVARPKAEQLQAASHLVEGMPQQAMVGWVLIGTTPYSADEVVAAYRIPVVGVMPDDARAARSLETGVAASRLRRSLLVREFGMLAERINTVLSAPPGPTVAPGTVREPAALPSTRPSERREPQPEASA